MSKEDKTGSWKGLHGGGPITKEMREHWEKLPSGGHTKAHKRLAKRQKHYDKTQSSNKGYTRPGSMKK